MSIHSFCELMDSIERNHGKDFRDAVLHRVLVKQGIPHLHLPHRGGPSKIPHCGKSGCDGSCLDVECDGSTPHSRQEAAVAEALRAWARSERRQNIFLAVAVLAAIAALLLGVRFLENRSLEKAKQRHEAERQTGQLERERCMCPTVTP